MKEDILEQLVDDYLQAKGYFTMHNVKFKPSSDTTNEYESKQDRVASDIDVIGFNPLHEGPDRVWVVSCKSWQEGFDPDQWISYFEKGFKQEQEVKQGKIQIIYGRPAWKYFRELVKQKWADAFLAKIKELTGTQSFTYVIAITKLKENKTEWDKYELFKQNLDGNPIIFLPVDAILDYLNEHTTKTVAPSDVGRLLQVIKASGWMQRKD
jgi:hypothetical protein